MLTRLILIVLSAIMSYCKEEGKDRIIFVTKEDHDVPSMAAIKILADDEDEEPGLLLSNGEINWACPCLGGMATGPCGVEFREAFSCFHHSTAEAKGADCYEVFNMMQDCMVQFPDVYPRKDDSDEDKDEDDLDDLNLGSLEIVRDVGSAGGKSTSESNASESGDFKRSEAEIIT